MSDRGADASWRPGLALVCVDTGQIDEARTQFNELATNDFAGIEQDSLRPTCLCYLAEVACVLDDKDRAKVLYDLLQPYRDLALVVGNATACLGATARYLGQLATLLGDFEAAERHFRYALELNERMAAEPWQAHTQFEYAKMLRLRGDAPKEAADSLVTSAAATAERLGMQALLSRISSDARDDSVALQ